MLGRTGGVRNTAGRREGSQEMHHIQNSDETFRYIQLTFNFRAGDIDSQERSRGDRANISVSRVLCENRIHSCSGRMHILVRTKQRRLHSEPGKTEGCCCDMEAFESLDGGMFTTATFDMRKWTYQAGVAVDTAGTTLESALKTKERL